MRQEVAEQEFQEKKRKKEELKIMDEKHRQKLIEQENNENKENDEDEKRSSFWLNNIYTGDVYRSLIKGTNPWAKSSGFTKKLQNTREAFQYYQNAKDCPLAPNYVKAIEDDKKMRKEFLKKEQEEKERLAKIDKKLKIKINY